MKPSGAAEPHRKAVRFERLHVSVCGAVQGVGFRPFVYRLASELRLGGWVTNTTAGVTLEVEGEKPAVREFLHRLEADKPRAAITQSVEATILEPAGYAEFLILPSTEQGPKTTIILPDLATCPDCVRDFNDPKNRRYRYPFTNCTNCGPRYSIIESLPYDRPNTTMRGFAMCPDCAREYGDPNDRRFHAQPNACPVCGPQLALCDGRGRTLEVRDDALRAAVAAVCDGKIVAIKGIGGYQLLVDATNEEAVKRLRALKHRDEKPLAIMFSSVEDAQRDCDIKPIHERLLRSMQAPIVLVERNGSTRIAPSVAAGSPRFGVMVPYSPLHHLLMDAIRRPVVATSGNISEEPICIDDADTLVRLAGIADLFLLHNRPIKRHVDDSVVQVVLDREMILRRARGYAPLPVTIPETGAPVIAVGAHQKCAVALSVGDQVFISQHIGDLNTPQAYRAFSTVISDLNAVYEHAPSAIACDMHPDYLSTQYARMSELPVLSVQHHYAHVLSCMSDNRINAPVLGVAWDGSGFGPDGTIWGGEFLAVDASGYTRVAHLRTFRLPGGEKAVREPRRCALGALSEIDMPLDDAPAHVVASFEDTELRVVQGMLARRLNAPLTSSMGRLFDVVASLVGIRQTVRHEGQAAMELEFTARRAATRIDYMMPIDMVDGCLRIDWEPMLRAIMHDVRAGVSVDEIAMRFHNSLAETVVAVATRVGADKVALTGGCFQNRLLTELCVERLADAGLKAYWHQRIPPNDGGIAVGQVLAAHRALAAHSEEGKLRCA